MFHAGHAGRWMLEALLDAALSIHVPEGDGLDWVKPVQPVQPASPRRPSTSASASSLAPI
jgi:hypothetical protein